MRTVPEILEQARADLERAEARERRAREAAAEARADVDRLTAFLATLGQYVQEGAKPGVQDGAKPARVSKETRVGAAAVEIITLHGRPMQIGPLNEGLLARGVDVGGGERRNAYLASYLSKDSRLRFYRGLGWWPVALGEPPSVEAVDSTSGDTEASDDESEASGVVGDPAANGVAGFDLWETPTYRMGGGGTRN